MEITNSQTRLSISDMLSPAVLNIASKIVITAGGFGNRFNNMYLFIAAYLKSEILGRAGKWRALIKSTDGKKKSGGK